MKAFPIIVSSPSGAGKTTIVDAVLKKNKTVSRVVTATTRAPRKGEKNGKDYHTGRTYRQGAVPKSGDGVYRSPLFARAEKAHFGPQ